MAKSAEMIHVGVVPVENTNVVIIQINMVDKGDLINKERGMGEHDPKCVRELGEKYRAFYELSRQGEDRLLWAPLNPKGNSVLETEYDLRIREEIFNLVDQTKDKLPALIPLTLIENDLSPFLGTKNLSLTMVKYFITATHEQYCFFSVGQDLDRKFDPASSEFIGIDQVREMMQRKAPETKGINIIPPKTQYLKKGQVQEEVDFLLSAVRRRLTEADRETYIRPVEQRIKELEEEKSAQIKQGIESYSPQLQKLISEILQLIPEDYRSNLPPYLDLGSTREDLDRREGVRKVLFISSRRRLVISPNIANISPSASADKLLKDFVESQVNQEKPEFTGNLSLKGIPKDWKLETASDADWLIYGKRILGKLASSLPKNYGEKLTYDALFPIDYNELFANKGQSTDQ